MWTASISVVPANTSTLLLRTPGQGDLQLCRAFLLASHLRSETTLRQHLCAQVLPWPCNSNPPHTNLTVCPETSLSVCMSHLLFGLPPHLQASICVTVSQVSPPSVSIQTPEQPEEAPTSPLSPIPIIAIIMSFTQG